MLDLTLGRSFKVKQWFTGFGELSFRWIQICIGLRCVGLVSSCYNRKFMILGQGLFYSKTYYYYLLLLLITITKSGTQFLSLGTIICTQVILVF